MSILRSDPVVVPRVKESACVGWREIRAGAYVPSGHRVIYAVGNRAFPVDGSQDSMIAAIGITDGKEVAAGGVCRYMPEGGLIDPSQIDAYGSLWAAKDGSVVPFYAVGKLDYTRRVATGIDQKAITVSFGETIQKEI